MDDEFDLLAALGDDNTEVVPKKNIEKQPLVIDEVAEVTEELIEKLSKKVTKVATERLIKNEPLVDKPVVKDNSKAECLRQITNILGEYGMESDIPVNHLYWRLINKYRVM